MRGGKAFTKPLPFPLGSNGSMFRYGISTTDLNQASAIGMKYYRNDISWVVNQGSTPIEGLPGVYSSSAVANAVSVAAATRAVGIEPIFCIGLDNNPGLCPTLSSALVSGTVYTSISVTQLAFPITSGDSIQLTTGPGGTVQTITAAANMAAGASGALTVNSFTAAANFAAASSTVAGAWVYDTAWVASTPQHLSDMMVHLASQSGLKGIDWEGPNEPDGPDWGITAPLLYQFYSIMYPAMKAADPTCTIHGLVLESSSPPGNGNGTDYYNELVSAAGGTPFHPLGVLWDLISLHGYSDDDSYNTDASPYYVNYTGGNMFTNMANFRANMVTKGDLSTIGWTEFGWPNGFTGPMTPQLQAQYYQDFLTGLSGVDPLGTPFSTYIALVCQFAMENSGAAWGIIGEPAIGVLTELVSGH